ncbi:MAG: PilZ domain-containing protein [Magnetococcales bacterium]|nr:PilZ domain-containing protein [Magnetococcales bacterium]
MQEDVIVIKAVQIRNILRRAHQMSSLIEVHLDQMTSRRHYGARIVQVPGGAAVENEDDDLLKEYASQIDQGYGGSGEDQDSEEGNEGEVLVLSPLEPADGNLKIRKARQITLKFYVGKRYYETRVSFRKVCAVDGGQGLEMSAPRALSSSSPRNQHRVNVPENIRVPVVAEKRGMMKFNARLIDISSGGLSFSCKMQQQSLLKGDKVTVVIGGEWGPISTFGTICYLATARDQDNVQKVLQQYGIKFQMLSLSDAMTVDRLVKDFQFQARRSAG